METLMQTTSQRFKLKHLENEINADSNITHIIQWSDGCGYQNRNKVLSSALLSLAHKKQITITQSILKKDTLIWR